MADIVGVPLPDRSGKTFYKVVAPIGFAPLKALILGRGLLGVLTHWIVEDAYPRGHNIACPGREKCLWDHEQWPLKWTGYIAALSAGQALAVILHITENAGRQLSDACAALDSLRGVRVCLQRQMPRKNGPVCCTLLGLPTGESLQDDPDIVPSLERLWGCRFPLAAPVEPVVGARHINRLAITTLQANGTCRHPEQQ